MDIWSMPEVRKIAAYLKNMTFKTKSVGGCDKEDVLSHFEKVTRMYGDVIENLQGTLLEEKERRSRAESEYFQKVDQLTQTLNDLKQSKEDILSNAQNEANELSLTVQTKTLDEKKRIEELQQSRAAWEQAYQKQIRETNEAYQNYYRSLQSPSTR